MTLPQVSHEPKIRFTVTVTPIGSVVSEVLSYRKTGILLIDLLSNKRKVRKNFRKGGEFFGLWWYIMYY